VRLDVGVVAAEELLGARSGQLLGHVHELAPAVVALGRVALGVLVGQHRSDRLEDRRADEVLRGDQLETGVLPVDLVGHRPRDVRIDVRQRADTAR